ncbi:transposase [Succinatimonas hippei]|nr:transposase [Succinatimonas hippei]
MFKLKGTSSMLIRKRKYPAVKAKLWGTALGRYLFALSCTGTPISIIRQYIDWQKTPD